MFSIIKWWVYACIAVIIYSIIMTAETSPEMQRNTASLNQRIERLFLQVNDGIDELSAQAAKIIKQ